MNENRPSAWTIESAAEVLLAAETNRTDRHTLTDTWPELDLDTAYRVQDQLVMSKLELGEQIVGVKLGLTSQAKQERMGIDSPLTAVLTDRMQLAPEAPLLFDELIHPRVEPEIVFVLRERLQGPGVTAVSAMAAVGQVHAGLEVIDSRFIDFKFTLPDVVADNASSARFVMSTDAHDPADYDLASELCTLRVDGHAVDSATGAAVQGHPAKALALAANALGRRGQALEAGWIVMTGGLTDAVFIHPGQQVSAVFENLGSISITAM